MSKSQQEMAGKCSAREQGFSSTVSYVPEQTFLILFCLFLLNSHVIHRSFIRLPLPELGGPAPWDWRDGSARTPFDMRNAARVLAVPESSTERIRGADGDTSTRGRRKFENPERHLPVLEHLLLQNPGISRLFENCNSLLCFQFLH